MKRAMGLVLLVLGFAAVAHADRIEYQGGSVRAGARDAYGVQAISVRAPLTAELPDDTVRVAPGLSIDLRALENSERLTDEVFFSPFGKLAKTAGEADGFGSIRGSLDGFPGTRGGGFGDRFRIEHPEPVHRYLGVQEIPEPGTLSMLAVGLVLITVWKR